MRQIDEEGFAYVFIDEIPKENQDAFIMWLFGKTVPEPINGRKRAYYGDYKFWWYHELK